MFYKVTEKEWETDGYNFRSISNEPNLTESIQSNFLCSFEIDLQSGKKSHNQSVNKKSKQTIYCFVDGRQAVNKLLHCDTFFY